MHLLEFLDSLFLTCVMISEKLIAISSQPSFICSNLTIETLEKGVKYVKN